VDAPEDLAPLLTGAQSGLEILRRLLRHGAESHTDKDWALFRQLTRGHIARASEAVEEQLEGCATIEDAEAVAAAVVRARAQVPTVSIALFVVAAARAIDRRFAGELTRAWVASVPDGHVFAPGELIVLAEPESLFRDIGQGRSIPPPFTRADDRPDRTRRALLFDPRPGAPPVRAVRAGAHALDAVVHPGTRLATCHPVAPGERWGHDFPVRPEGDAATLPARCLAQLQLAHDLGATVVVFPELVGYEEVVAALRSFAAGHPMLIVAGSGHEGTEEGGDRRNECRWWFAGRGRVGPVRTVLKRVGYEGAQGAELLDVVGPSIDVLLGERWRFAVTICRDGLQEATVDSLRQVGVNLLAIPAWSPKTTSLARSALDVGGGVPGIVLVANGQAETADDPPQPVPLAVVVLPVDRGEPIALVRGPGPGVVIVDLPTATVGLARTDR
jgi:predicted amidohydrolase